MTKKELRIIAWLISGCVLALAVIAWAQRFNWQLGDLTVYQIFPLFGLAAFSLMWSHYIVSALRRYQGHDKSSLHVYFEATSLMVLAAILLHPGLLAWQLWRDGAGLPPASELNYVQPALKGAVIIGMFAWVLFIAYELRRKYRDKTWWKYVQYASDFAMVLILVHGFRLGNTHWPQWYKALWLFYAISFGFSLYIIYTSKLHERTIAKKS